MSVHTAHRPASARPAPPAPPTSKGTLSWKIARRIAIYDLRHYPARAVVTLGVIAVPLILVFTALSLANAGAQLADGKPAHSVYVTGTVDGTSDPSGKTIADHTAFIDRTTGVSHTPMREGAAYLDGAGDPVRLKSLAINAVLPGEVELTSGRWPSSASDILATPRGMHLGLPESGPVTLLVDGTPQQRTVVGTAHNLLSWDVAFVEPLPTTDGPVGVSWQGDYSSRPNHGQSINEPGYRSSLSTGDHTVDLWTAARKDHSKNVDDLGASAMVLACAFVVLLLLGVIVAPAFATGVRRRSQLASDLLRNGAPAGKMRRIAVVQGAVLGALAVAVAVAGIVITVPLSTWLVNRTIAPAWPLQIHVPWSTVAIVGVGAVTATSISAGIAAFAASRRLTATRRLTWPRRPSIVFAVSVALALLALMSNASFLDGIHQELFFGAVITACVSAVPVVFAVAAHLSSTAPPSLRFGLRDAARSRARTAPATVALMALTALGVWGGTVFMRDAGLSTGNRFPHGGYVEVVDFDASSAGKPFVADVAERATLSETPLLTLPSVFLAEKGAALPSAWLTHPACTVTVSTHDGLLAPTWDCQFYPDDVSATVLVADADTLATAFGLTDSQREEVAQGAVLSSHTLGDSPGEFTLHRAPVGSDGAITAGQATQDTVNVVYIENPRYALSDAVRYAVTPDFLTRHRLPTKERAAIITSRERPLTSSDYEGIRARLPSRAQATEYNLASPGISQTRRWWVAGAVAGGVGIVAALVLGLNRMELTQSFGMWHAVGGTRRSVRAIAATQGWWITTVALVLGVAVVNLEFLPYGPSGEVAQDTPSWTWVAPEFLALLAVVPFTTAVVTALSVRAPAHVDRRVS